MGDAKMGAKVGKRSEERSCILFHECVAQSQLRKVQLSSSRCGSGLCCDP
jgi:hypothetical protein